MKKGLTIKDIKVAEAFIDKSSDIQLILWIGRLSDELYKRMERK